MNTVITLTAQSLWSQKHKILDHNSTYQSRSLKLLISRISKRSKIPYVSKEREFPLIRLQIVQSHQLESKDLKAFNQSSPWIETAWIVVLAVQKTLP